MVDIEPPKEYGVKVTLLPPHQLPYGPDCGLDRTIQSFAFHYGLSQDNADTLKSLQLTSLRSFSTCDPDGDEEQVNTSRLILAYFTSPVAISLVGKMIRRLCSGEPLAAVPKPTGSVRKSAAGGGSKGKKAKVDASGVVDDGAVPSTSGSSQAPSDATPATPAADASGTVKSAAASSDSDSDSDDSDLDLTSKDTKADKLSKSDKAPKDLNLMVEEMGSAVSLIGLLTLFSVALHAGFHALSLPYRSCRSFGVFFSTAASCESTATPTKAIIPESLGILTMSYLESGRRSALPINRLSRKRSAVSSRRFIATFRAIPGMVFLGLRQVGSGFRLLGPLGLGGFGVSLI